MAITTDGDGIMLKLGRLVYVNSEHIVCLSQTLPLLAGDFPYEKCSLRTMQGTLQKIRLQRQSKTKITSAIVFLALPKLSPITDNIVIVLKILSIIVIKKFYR